MSTQKNQAQKYPWNGLSKSIIENHEDSSFTFKSEEGKGTVFKVTMPITKTSLSLEGKDRGEGKRDGTELMIKAKASNIERRDK